MEDNNVSHSEIFFKLLEMENNKKTILNTNVSEFELNKQINFQLIYEFFQNEFKLNYGLSWSKKYDAIKSLYLHSEKTLQHLIGKGINEDNSHHYFIEGDNLEVLKFLKKSYAEKIKVIYIDPPYNTGQAFVYNDNFFAKNKQRKVKKKSDHSLNNANKNNDIHGDWLSMIYPRLLLAKDFLAEDGIIFISIDDNEIHNLRILMDEIFGSQHFCGTIKRRASRKNTFLSKCMSDMFDYIVIYSKNAKLPFLSSTRNSEKTRPVFNEGNKISTRVIAKGTLAKCPDGKYKPGIYKNRSIKYEILNEMNIKNSILVNSIQVKAPWRINQEIVNKTIFITKKKGFRRNVLPEELNKKAVLSDFLDLPECYNEKGSEELKLLFDNKKRLFNNPKPTGLIQYLLKCIELKAGDYVLDFFAGSGTTLHAILNLNATGLYHLNSISIQNSSDNISLKNEIGFYSIYELALERVKRAINYIDNHNKNLKKSNVSGVKCFKLVDRKIHNINQAEAMSYADNIIKKHDCANNYLNYLWEIAFLEGLTLATNIQKPVIANYLNEKLYIVKDVTVNKVLLVHFSEILSIAELELCAKLAEKFENFDVILFVMRKNSKCIYNSKQISLHKYNIKFLG